MTGQNKIITLARRHQQNQHDTAEMLRRLSALFQTDNFFFTPADGRVAAAAPDPV
jgi:hypothetical protein